MNRKQTRWNLVCVPPSQKQRLQRETPRTIEIHLKDLHSYPTVIQLIRVTTKESGQNGRQSTQEKKKLFSFEVDSVSGWEERELEQKRGERERGTNLLTW